MPGIHELQEENRIFLYQLFSLLSQYKHLLAGPPKIEVEDKDHIYLLSDKGERRYRICGQPLRGLPKVFVCKQKAGHKTEHAGIGPCSVHETKNEIALKKRTDYLWSLLNKERGLPATLSELVEYAKKIDQRVLESVDPDIKIMYSLLGWVLNKPDERGEINPLDIRLAMKILGNIVEAKKVKKAMESETKLDMESVTMFVEGIFKILIKHSPQIQAQQMMADILREVIRPMKEKNRIIEDVDFKMEDLIPKQLRENNE